MQNFSLFTNFIKISKVKMPEFSAVNAFFRGLRRGSVFILSEREMRLQVKLKLWACFRIVFWARQFEVSQNFWLLFCVRAVSFTAAISCNCWFEETKSVNNLNMRLRPVELGFFFTTIRIFKDIRFSEDLHPFDPAWKHPSEKQWRSWVFAQRRFSVNFDERSSLFSS